MTTPLYPVEAQCHVFRQLLAYETLFNPEIKLQITRQASGNLLVYLVDTGCILRTWLLDPDTIPTTKKLDATLAKFWKEVPPRYKLKP